MTCLLVGLGNPGQTYAGHRHNIGFMVMDAIARRYTFQDFSSKFDGLWAKGTVDGEDVHLFKPQEYMNLSGGPVQKAMQFFKVPLDKVFVFHDEIDLKPGQIRIKKGGGAGGHNGIKDIDATVGKEYWRIRIGVGRPLHKTQVSDYVLTDFEEREMEWLDSVLDAMPEALQKLLGDKPLDYAQAVLKNSKPYPNPPKADEPEDKDK